MEGIGTGTLVGSATSSLAIGGNNTAVMEFKGDNNTEFSVYPNPSDGQNINLGFVAKKGTELVVVISAANGAKYFSNTINALSEGDNDYSIHLATKLSTGVYFISITSGQTVYNKKLVVN